MNNKVSAEVRKDFILKDIHKGYLVGGSLRDILMNKCYTDRDITVKDAEKFAKELSEKLEGTFIILDSVNKIFRIVLNDKENYLDISELRGDTIDEDLLHRDFTINALAYNLENDKLIDITSGIKDIETKTIKAVKEENFKDDPLRILRAYRFMATTGFKFDRNLNEIIKKYMPLLNQPAKERIHDEIMKLFGGKFAAKTILKMYEDRILEIIFPSVKDIEKIPKNSHHHLDLIHHVIETVKHVEIIYNNSENKVKEHMNRIDFGGYPRINHLKIAAFLHDIGKPSTWTIEEGGRHRFIKHDIKGAELAKPLLKNLKFSNKQIDYITEMIRKHIYPSNVISAPDVDAKNYMRYIRKMNDNVIDNIILAQADRLSAQGPDVTKEMTDANINGLNKLLSFYLEIKDSLKPLPKLIDGNDVMKILNIKQSPLLGEILDGIKEAQINGDIVTKDDAIKFVKNYSF